MDSIVSNIREKIGKVSDDERENMLETLENLIVELRDPRDSLYRTYASSILVPLVKIGSDIGVFQKLAGLEPGSSKTVSQLADETGAGVDLLERVLRYLASIKNVQEVGPDQYAANELTRTLANPKIASALTHGIRTMNPAINATPAFLEETGYKDVTDSSNTPFQKAFNTKLKAFDYISQVPEMFDALQVVMTAFESSDWTVGFDLFENEVKLHESSSSSRQFLIDVGGGHGHQCVQLLKKYPGLRGKLTVEDLPEAIEKAPRLEGISYLAQDFFKPQAVSGAKFYYLRRIMHDWPEDECVQILKQLVDVFEDDSRILLDEVVLPDTGAHWQATMADISMMIVFAGAERTHRKWQQLVGKAGLKISQLHTYDKKSGHSIIVLEKP